MFPPKLQYTFPHMLWLALFIPKLSGFYHLNPCAPSVSSLLRLLRRLKKQGQKDLKMKLEGEYKKRREVGESERREAEWTLRQKAFWFKAMTLVSDVWKKKANLGEGWRLWIGCVYLQACKSANGGVGVYTLFILVCFSMVSGLYILDCTAPPTETYT